MPTHVVRLYWRARAFADRIAYRRNTGQCSVVGHSKDMVAGAGGRSVEVWARGTLALIAYTLMRLKHFLPIMTSPE